MNTWVYVNEMTFRNLQEWGLVAREANQVIRGLGFSEPSPTFRKGKKGWSFNYSPMARDLINCASVMELP